MCLAHVSDFKKEMFYHNLCILFLFFFIKERAKSPNEENYTLISLGVKIPKLSIAKISLIVVGQL
jgi:hypothetical protein